MLISFHLSFYKILMSETILLVEQLQELGINAGDIANLKSGGDFCVTVSVILKLQNA